MPLDKVVALSLPADAKRISPLLAVKFLVALMGLVGSLMARIDSADAGQVLGEPRGILNLLQCIRQRLETNQALSSNRSDYRAGRTYRFPRPYPDQDDVLQ